MLRYTVRNDQWTKKWFFYKSYCSTKLDLRHSRHIMRTVDLNAEQVFILQKCWNIHLVEHFSDLANCCNISLSFNQIPVVLPPLWHVPKDRYCSSYGICPRFCNPRVNISIRICSNECWNGPWWGLILQRLLKNYNTILLSNFKECNPQSLFWMSIENTCLVFQQDMHLRNLHLLLTKSSKRMGSSFKMV